MLKFLVKSLKNVLTIFWYRKFFIKVYMTFTWEDQMILTIPKIIEIPWILQVHKCTDFQKKVIFLLCHCKQFYLGESKGFAIFSYLICFNLQVQQDLTYYSSVWTQDVV